MNKWALCACLGVVGCTAPRNVAPVTVGVPDGMIVGRTIIPTPRPDIRVEEITVASGDKPLQAWLLTPINKLQLPAKLVYGRKIPPDLDDLAAPDRVVVVTTEANRPHLNLRKVAELLEEVDPKKIID